MVVKGEAGQARGSETCVGMVTEGLRDGASKAWQTERGEGHGARSSGSARGRRKESFAPLAIFKPKRASNTVRDHRSDTARF